MRSKCSRRSRSSASRPCPAKATVVPPVLQAAAEELVHPVVVDDEDRSGERRTRSRRGCRTEGGEGLLRAQRTLARFDRRPRRSRPACRASHFPRGATGAPRSFRPEDLAVRLQGMRRPPQCLRVALLVRRPSTAMRAGASLRNVSITSARKPSPSSCLRLSIALASRLVPAPPRSP